MINIDTESKIPVYKQTVHGIIGLTENNTLPVGTRSPSTGQLSVKLGINRTTVYHAYQELLALGYIESRPGAYTRVRKRARPASPGRRESRSVIAWNSVSTPSSRRLYKAHAGFFTENATSKQPGNAFFHSSSPKKYIRISIANLKEEEVIRLCKLFEELASVQK